MPFSSSLFSQPSPSPSPNKRKVSFPPTSQPALPNAQPCNRPNHPANRTPRPQYHAFVNPPSSAPSTPPVRSSSARNARRGICNRFRPGTKVSVKAVGTLKVEMPVRISLLLLRLLQLHILQHQRLLQHRLRLRRVRIKQIPQMDHKDHGKIPYSPPREPNRSQLTTFIR